mgnify:CR=1 FL=1
MTGFGFVRQDNREPSELEKELGVLIDNAKTPKIMEGMQGYFVDLQIDDFGVSGVYVGTTPENVSKVKELIIEEFGKVSKELTDKELNSVKDQIIGNYFISQEDSFSVMYDLLKSEIKGDAKDVYKFIDKIKDVKLEDVKNLASIKDWSFFALVPE